MSPAPARVARPQASGCRGLDFTVTRSIGTVDVGGWDALAGGDILSSHGWLHAVERAIPALEPRYLLLHQDGRLVAAAVCYSCDAGNPYLSPDGLMFRRLLPLARRLRLTWLPALGCGSYLSYGTPLLVDARSSNGDGDGVRDRLLDALEQLADRDGLPLWISRFRTGEKETIDALKLRGYHRTEVAPLTFLDISWDSFDGYVAHLKRYSKNMAATVRLEVNRNRRMGVVIRRIEEPERFRNRLYELADGHYRRLNARPVPYDPDLLPAVKRSLDSDAVLYGAFQDDALIGFSLMLKRGGVGYVNFIGLDAERTRDNFTYFNLAYYRPIADAIAERLRRVYFGRLLYGLKARRGCHTEALHLFYRSPSAIRHAALRPWFAFHAAWMRRKLSRLEDLDRLRRPGHA